MQPQTGMFSAFLSKTNMSALFLLQIAKKQTFQIKYYSLATGKTSPYPCVVMILLSFARFNLRHGDVTQVHVNTNKTVLA